MPIQRRKRPRRTWSQWLYSFCERITHRKINRILSQIEALARVPEREAAVPPLQQELLQWLAVANNGVYHRNSLNYSHEEQKTIFDFIEEQGHQRKRPHLTQSWIGFIHRLWNSKQPALFNFYPRFILWLRAKTGLASALPATDLTARLTAYLSKGEEEKKGEQPLAQERYTPGQLMQQWFPLEQQPTRFPDRKKPAFRLPSHLLHWVENLAFVHQQNQENQHLALSDQKGEVKLNLELEGEEEVQQQQLTDHSQLRVSDFGTRERGNMATPYWLKPLVKAVFAESDQRGLCSIKLSDLPYEEQNKRFFISEEAEEAIETSFILGFNQADQFELRSLPAGFFITPRSKPREGFALRYDREWCSKKPRHKHLPLLISPTPSKKVKSGRHYFILKNSKYLSLAPAPQGQAALNYWEVLAQEFLDESRKKSQDLSQYFHEICQAWYHKLRLQKEQIECLKDIRISKELLLLIYQQSSLADTRDFIDFLTQLNRRPKTEQEKQETVAWSVFINPYWREYPQCNWTRHLPALRIINGFTQEEFLWFRALSQPKADLDQIVYGLAHFFQFLKNKDIPLPPVSSVLDLPLYDSRQPMHFVQLNGIVNCITDAKEEKLQIKWVPYLPMGLSLACAQLRAGYRAVHRAMCFDRRSIYDEEDFRERFSQLKNPFQITQRELQKLSYQELKQPPAPPMGWAKAEPRDLSADQYAYQKLALSTPLLYRAFFLRYCAANLDGENFQRAIAHWEAVMEEKLTDLADSTNPKDYWYRGTEKQQQRTALAERLATHWQKLKEFALSLPLKIQADTAPAPVEWLTDEPPPSPKHYDLDAGTVILQKIGVEAKEQEALRKDLDYLNSRALAFPKEHSLFQSTIEKAVHVFRDATAQPEEQYQAMLECLALMREAHFRLSREKETKTQPKKAGEWLRLEQVLPILLDYRKNGLFQIKTDEGKTLILGLGAMLQALQGKAVTVLTHTEAFAIQHADKLTQLAQLFGLSVTARTSRQRGSETADIIYTDIASGVIHQQRQALVKKGSPAETKATAKSKVAKVDEVDNVVIDVHANTRMQIALGFGKTAAPELVVFLKLLNKTVRKTLVRRRDLTSKAAQREQVRQAMQKDAYYCAHCQNEEATLDEWISAAVTAMRLKEKEDYVITENRVRIVHKDSTGAVDAVSQWSKGVHQVISAWEQRKKGERILIPALSQVLAQGNVHDFLQTEFDAVSGYTGTLGEKAVTERIEKTVFKENEPRRTFRMPPATRPRPPGVSGPLLPPRPVREEKESKGPLEKKQPPQEEAIKRFYKFPLQVFDNYNDYLQALLDAVRHVQRQGLSLLLSVTFIQQGEDLFQFLIDNGIDPRTLQIFDDTETESKREQVNQFRPGEKAVLAQAKNKGMITISTAIGGRGTDFDCISVRIGATPKLRRGEEQEEGRVARHGERGISYEIYWAGQLRLPGTAKKSPAAQLKAWQKAKQQEQLERINNREKQSAAFFAGREREGTKTEEPSLRTDLSP